MCLLHVYITLVFLKYGFRMLPIYFSNQPVSYLYSSSMSSVYSSAFGNDFTTFYSAWIPFLYMDLVLCVTEYLGISHRVVIDDINQQVTICSCT